MFLGLHQDQVAGSLPRKSHEIRCRSVVGGAQWEKETIIETARRACDLLNEQSRNEILVEELHEIPIQASLLLNQNLLPLICTI
jgi:hypothetical protein